MKTMKQPFFGKTLFESIGGINSAKTLTAILSGLIALAVAIPMQAASVMEEVVVTAQRTEESIQDVPIAVTAISGEMLEDKGIINPSDLQMAAPNVSFTATNFGGSSFSIRGIGRLVISGSGENGVSTHINEIAVGTNLNAIEFFDVQRVEVLRGPQGTLFGRNSTGGSINMVTNMPDYDALGGFVDVELGDYSHVRVKGAVNIPFSDTMGIRLAAFNLTRDGFIENLAGKSVSNIPANIMTADTMDDRWAAGDLSAVNGTKLSHIDDDIDGRDILAYRLTWAWDFSDNGDMWIQYNGFEEDDDRARITNQVCKRSELPIHGCEPNGFGFDSPHLTATTGGLFFALNGAAGLDARGMPLTTGTIPVGAYGPGDPRLLYDHAPDQSELGLRTVFTDFEPVYMYEESLITTGVNYEFGNYTLGFLGAFQETEFVGQTDYNVNVGSLLPASPASLGRGGKWPTSAPAGGAGGDVIGRRGCKYADGTAGIFGGCIVPGSDIRQFAMDQASSETETWTAEVRLSSELDGPVNFQVGVSAFEGESFGDYYVNANSLDSVGLLGASVFGSLPLYPTMFNNYSNPGEPTTSEGTALFAEVYYDITDRLKLTVGVRQNEDDKSISDANAFVSSFDQNIILFGAAGSLAASGLITLDAAAIGALVAAGTPQAAATAAVALQTAIATDIPGAGGTKYINPNYAEELAKLPGRRWGRTLTILAAPAPSAADRALLLHHGVTAAEITAAFATQGASPQRIALMNRIGPIPGFNEVRTLSGSPTETDFSSTTGRIGLDYQVNDDMLVYGFFTRGYKPGGFNPPISTDFQVPGVDRSTLFTFDEEEVDSLEFGFKSTLADGQVILNGTAFIYDYTGLQVTRIRNNSSINENIDADIMGLEIEWAWQPSNLENFGMDGSFAWLDTSLKDVMSVDVLNKTAGNADWVDLKDIGPGALTATQYIARRDQLTAQVIADAYATNRALNIPGTKYEDPTPNNNEDNAIPAYFARTWLSTMDNAATAATLEGPSTGPVDVSWGLEQSLKGNSLPNAPELTMNLGVQYTWPIERITGALTLRWDYYWQDESYAREFNTKGDEIEGWDQHNLSLIYESTNGDWQARFWARNLQDEDNVTGHYVTSDTSGFFRNYFLTEPRILGLSVRYKFGGM